MNTYISSFYKENNDIWGKPQVYKGLNIYPIKIIDDEYMDLFYRLLFFHKNTIPDKTIIKMSYLKFLLYVVSDNGYIKELEIDMYDLLSKFLKYIFKEDNVEIVGYFKQTVETLDTLVLKIKVKDVVLDEYDFDVIRAVILQQNGCSYEYVEEYNPDLEEKLKFMNRQNSDITFKDQIFSLAALCNKTLEEVGQSFTMFQMKNWIRAKDDLMSYGMYHIELSLPEGSEIKHYLNHHEDGGRYSNILIDKDSFVKKGEYFKSEKEIAK